MTDVFSMMMDMLSGDNIADYNCSSPVHVPSSDMQDRLAEVLALQAPKIEPIVHIPVAPLPNDNIHNILGAEARERFCNERVYYETYLFTAPINTTNTTSGFLTNVDFMEEDLIMHVSPDERIVVYRCNYGKEVYVGYTEPVKVKKTNRGRKKKEKKKKPRKKQGNGTDFNSQMTFIVVSTTVELVDGIVPLDAPVYKIKVFRNGKIQLPGMARDSADDAIACAQIVCNELNHLLHAGAADTKLVYLNPVMKNYRIRIKLEDLCLDGPAMVNLSTLKLILAQDRITPNPEAPPHPAVFDIKYDDGETKLSIKFSTPIARKPTKKTRVNLMTRGKINILGAFDADATYMICDYLHWLFEEHFDRLIIVEGGQRAQIHPHEDNVDVSDYVEEVEPHIDITDILYELDAADQLVMAQANEWVAMLATQSVAAPLG